MLPNGTMPMPAAKPLEVEAAIKICDGIADKARSANCIQDVSVTGEASFADVYRQSEKMSRVARLTIKEPILSFPDDFQKDLSGGVNFSWSDSADAERTGARYRLCVWPEDQEFGFNFCSPEALRINNFDMPKLEDGKTYFWKVIVEGEGGSIAESETRRLTMK
jgi:hypothetical protein